MSFATFQAAIDALPGQSRLHHISAGLNVSGVWNHEWNGSTPPVSPGEAPTTSDTSLNIIRLAAPSGTNKLYLARFIGVSENALTFNLYDRLYHMSGLSGTVTTAQTVNNGTVALPARGGTGEGVEIWLDCYTQTGTTATTVTASYTNQAGTAGRTTPSLAYPASMRAQQTLRLPLNAADSGVRSVESVTLAGTTGTAGNFGVTLAKYITTVSLPAGTIVNRDIMDLLLPEVDQNAVLYPLFFTGSSSGTLFNGWFHFIEG